MKKSLAILALKERLLKVLKLCLDQGGFAFEAYFEDEANLVDETKDPETFRVLEQSHFRQLYPRGIPRDIEDKEDDGVADDDHDDEDDDGDYDYDPAVEFGVGGSHPVLW